MLGTVRDRRQHQALGSRAPPGRTAVRLPAPRRSAASDGGSQYVAVVADVPIPTYVDVMLPTLQALEKLGGSGTKEEIDEAAVEVIGLSDAQLGVEFPPESTQKGSKVLHRLAWARSYLKKFGALNNSTRGVWTLEPPARQFLDAEKPVAVAMIRAADSEARRELRARRLASAAVALPHTAADDVPPDETADDGDDTSDWKGRLLGRLGALEPSAFERLAQRLLREAGFRNVEVTGRSGDRGIDGVGVYRPSLVSFPIYFQCKKWAGTVGSSEVRDFRGAMVGRGEKGLLITTGTFSAEARREATRDGAPPVDLIDGPDLCDLLKEYGVGVRSRMTEVVELESSFFDGL